MRSSALLVALSLLTFGHAFAAAPAAKPPRAPVGIALPGGAGGIGFDDLGYSRTLGKLLVPAGRTGNLDLVDPLTGTVEAVPGFSAQKEFSGGHDDGVTSVAEGAGFLFATDRTSEQLSIVDPATRTIVGHAALGAGPDYVRWIEATHELWVTEPDSERFEVFHLESGTPPRLTPTAVVPLPGGPEALVIDAKRGRAYTHVGEGKTAAIDLTTHAVVETWSNGCEEAKGVALDAERGLLFIACDEGGIVALDVTNGRTVGRIKLAGGIDIIAYSPELGHVYVPSSGTATLAIVAVSGDGALKLLGKVPGTKDSHCVATAGKVFFGDPAHGRLRVVKDPYPASTR